MKKELLNSEKTAIIVIDVQNDFCSKESFAAKNWAHDVSHFDLLIDKMKRFLSEAYLQGLEIVYTKTIYDPEKMPLSIKNKLGEVLGKYVAPDSWGIDFYSLKPQKDKIFIKYAFSAFTNQELLKHLKQRGMENIIFIGFNSNICVESSARDAVDLGFNVILLRDLTATPTFMQNHETAFLETFNLIFGEVLSSEEVLDLWKKEVKGGKNGK